MHSTKWEVLLTQLTILHVKGLEMYTYWTRRGGKGVQAPSGVVLGATVVEGAMLVLGAAVVAVQSTDKYLKSIRPISALMT